LQGKMRVLVLSSVSPNFAHFRAAQTVLAHLLQELAQSNLDVSYAVAELKPGTDAESEARLRSAGVTALHGPQPVMTPSVPPASRIVRAVDLARQLIDPRSGREDPDFAAPDVEIERVLSSGAQAAILFWDTCYEQLVPALGTHGLPVFGYLARPPFAAAQITVREKLSGVRRRLETLRLYARQRRHFDRLRHLAGARNICALDAAWYSRERVACRYLPNTWPDPFGENWAAARAVAECRRDGIHILANIGGLNATGNHYGMMFFADRVLPLLDRALAGRDWTANICGRFELPRELARLAQHPRVALRGFVPDIDEEMSGNHLFLLLNNSGPYTGGYTRVIYAFATGACLIAHRRLANSMPELVADENCLLGETPEDVAGLIIAAASDPQLRSRIGTAARRTYIECYRPSRVASGIRDMVMERQH
jgi:hypothetical protein